MKIPLSHTLLGCALMSLVSAQFGFTNPDGNLEDLSQTFEIGSTVPVAWSPGWGGYGDDPIYADLFLTSFESDAYNTLIITNYSTAEGGNLNWRVNIPTDVVEAEHGHFSFKWVRALNPPNYFNSNPGAVLSPSRGFNVRLGSSSSSTRSSSATSGSGSTSASTSASSASGSSTSPPPGDSGSSTPVGAIVGGVVGGVAAILAVAFLLFWLRRRKSKAAAPPSPTAATGGFGSEQQAPPQYAYHAAETRPEVKQVYEFDTAQGSHELPGMHAPVEADSRPVERTAK